MEAIYFKLYDHLFYRISKGSVTKIDTEKRTLVNPKHTPACPVKFIVPITKEEYEDALKSITLNK